MLHTIKRPWKLRYDDCPCDVHFVDWLAAEDVRAKTIFHFGSGEHHHVGLSCAQAAAMNSVLAITATAKEHDAYVKLCMKRPEVSKRYVLQFGDIYNLNTALTPPLDIVTLFHLCEFRDERNDAYGALSDRELVDRLSGQIRPNGHLLFYTGSYAYDRARIVIDAWAADAPFHEVDAFKTLRVFQRAAS